MLRRPVICKTRMNLCRIYRDDSQSKLFLAMPTVKLDCQLSLFSQSSGRANHEKKLGETGPSERAEGKLGERREKKGRKIRIGS